VLLYQWEEGIVISRRLTPRQPGRRYLTALAATGLLASLLLAGGTALAVHDTGRFQLDGDAASGTNTANTPTAADDWDKVCYEAVQKAIADGGEGLTAVQAAARCGINTGTTGPASSTSWTAEPNTSASIFTGGGSKDPIDVTQWAWKDAGGLPDKDNLIHGFGARYSLTPSSTCPSDPDGGGPLPAFATCEVLYFGSDRYDNSGDAQQGVWFLQSKVTTAGAKSGGGTGFTGSHKTGDILVISDFSNGGSVSTMKIFKWQPICTATNKSSDTNTIPNGQCADANLQSLASSDAANCTSVGGPGDAFCGLVNPSTITMPWSFTDKSGTANNGALNGELYEGGINLSTLNLAGECFSSILLETRSSTSTTAVLKDFVLGQLGNCAPGMTTQASSNGTVAPGTAITDTATITITGASSPADPTGTVTFFLCGPGATGCATGGTNIGTGTLNGGAVTNDGIATATSPSVNDSGQTGVRASLLPGRYCFRAEWPGDSNYNPTSHSNNTTECFTVAKLPSDTATGSSPTGGNVVPGTSVTDTATVTPTNPGGPTPTGSVTFFLCQPSEVTTGGCEGTAGTQVGAVKPLDSNGQATSDATSNTTAIGTYCWRAEYGGSNTYLASSHTNSTTECFTTVKQPSQTVTTSNPTGDVSNGLGSTATDTATVTPVTAGQPTPTGSVTFFLCQPNEVTSGGCEGTAGTQVGAVKPLNGSGQATSDASPALNTLGKYCWRAEYGGSNFYLPSSHTNSTTECFTIKTSSSGTSVQRWLPNDRIVLTSVGQDLAGLITVELRSGTCTGSVVYTDATAAAFTATTAGAVYQTGNTSTYVGSNPDGTPALAAGTYVWRVVFTPNSTFASGFTKCETSTVSINNNP
jgi:hypothetical protein